MGGSPEKYGHQIGMTLYTEPLRKPGAQEYAV